MGGYKNVTTETRVSAVDDAIFSLEELGDECREIVDSASEGRRRTSRIQVLDKTAGTLGGIRSPGVPECVANLPMAVTAQRSTRKGHGESRVARRDNGLAALRAARDAADDWADMRISEIEDEGGDPDHDKEVQAAARFVGELEDIIHVVERCELPGMCG